MLTGGDHGPLARLRRGAGLTQEELAERAGLSVRSVRNLECGAVDRPRTSTLRAIGAGLGLGDAQLSDLLELYRLRRRAEEAHDLAEAPPGPVAPLQLPPRPSAFTGRTAELAALDAALAADGRDPRLVVVGGLAGAGKTALALAWAHTRQESFPDGVLYVDLCGSCAGQPRPPEAIVDHLLADLGVASLPAASSAEARAALLRRTLVTRRMLLVLDDAGSAGQVRPLLPGPGDCATVVISRYTLRGLSIRDGARHVVVGSLADDDAAELIRNLLGAAHLRGAPAAVDAIVERTAGLPLALRIASDHLTRRPAAQAQAALEAWLAEPVPLDAFHTADDAGCDLRTVFAEPYRRLTPQAARCLHLASALPEGRMARAALTASWSLTPRAAHRVLAELTSAHLLEEPLPDQYTMHGLVREFVQEVGFDEDIEPLTDVSRWTMPNPVSRRPVPFPVKLP
ncbi:helix-turn-helix domain-containing protein [Promicromonospora sp. NPDC060271]|uniref:helix-turn-helix domain-containing protein n=1 Tax=Promicromonospora sp. NPDC060271 TaxID=3347089 RepID=UPI003662F8C6